MSGASQVQSVEAVDAFRSALAKFELRSQSALEALTAELRRAIAWIEYDCPAYWKQQTKLAEDQVHQLKLDLERCLIFPVAGERPSCREERSVLKKGQQRLEHCCAQSERVKHWKRNLQHELFEYQGRVGELQRMLETDLPAARVTLQQIVRRLDEYQIERPPEFNTKNAEMRKATEKNIKEGG